MKKEELISWLKLQQPTIELIILNGAKEFVAKHDSKSNFSHDLSCSQKEGYNLMNGVDLCYDRYTTALSYSLWYQARRINVFLSQFIDKIIDACDAAQPIDVFDLGAGTGCVQLCFGLVSACFQRSQSPLPLLRIINVDSSPFMLDYLREYIWPQALSFYPEFKSLAIEYRTCSWSNSSDIDVVNPWICASYLFDSSDNADYLSQHFEQLINDFNPQKILLLTSAQESKKTMINNLSKKMLENEYIVSTTANPFIFSGDLLNVTAFRKRLIAKYSLTASLKSVSWIDGSFTGTGLSKKQTGLSFGFKPLPQEYDLFNAPMKIRREVKLNDLQSKAAEFETRPSIITGPAGCGKSVVMTEKIINTLDHFEWQVSLNFLVTTFNKSLLKQLRLWITDLLKKRNKAIRQIFYSGNETSNDGTGEIIIKGGVEIKIKFVHFEMLGKYIGSLRNRPFEENTHRVKIEKIITDVKVQFELKEQEYIDVLNADFILEEYHRVIYGLSCKVSDGLETYKNLSRTGRGTKIQLSVRKREIIWNVLNTYVRWMFADAQAGHSFIARRQIFLNLLNSENDDTIKFDYVFVDEFQDCTPADFKIMSKLLNNVNNLILAGDLAQAVHIGQSGTIPKDEDMSNRKYHRLYGSYRLPYRISEAIQPLSHHISGYSENKAVTLEIAPSKGAPPGARPIIVYASDNLELSKKLISIKESYSAYNVKLITILEYDGDLCRAIRTNGSSVETSTVLKLKGLEKEMIVWSLQAEVEFQNEVMEFAYTILTRTNCLLVIAITTERIEYNLSALAFLRKDRLIYWDQDTENYLISIDLSCHP